MSSITMKMELLSQPKIISNTKILSLLSFKLILWGQLMIALLAILPLYPTFLSLFWIFSAKCLKIYRRSLKLNKKLCSKFIKKKNHRNIWKFPPWKCPLKAKLIKINGFSNFIQFLKRSYRKALNLYNNI